MDTSGATTLEIATQRRDATLKALEGHTLDPLNKKKSQAEFDRLSADYHQAQAVHHKLTRKGLKLDSYQPMYDVFLDFLHEKEETKERFMTRRRARQEGKTPSQVRRAWQIKTGKITTQEAERLEKEEIAAEKAEKAHEAKDPELPDIIAKTRGKKHAISRGQSVASRIRKAHEQSSGPVNGS